jgi:selenide,water dikinase
MGGEVLMALNVVGFPQDADLSVLAEIFRGGAEKVAEAGGVIVGGHTVYDAEPKYGLAVTGTIHPDRILTKGGARPGDALVLTKPLGTGIVLTAARADADVAGHSADAVESMMVLNRHASHIARECGAHAMTDITGFGLLGHAREMAARSDARLVFDASRIPALPGALEYAAQGILTGGAARNREGTADHIDTAGEVDPALEHLLYDPQTSGGLLIALPPEDADAMVARLRADGSAAATMVGRVEAGVGVRVA